MRRNMTKTQKQAGFTLIEVGIAAMIAAMVATIGLYYDAQQILYKKVHGQVDQLKVLSGALGKYERTNFDAIVANTAVTGVAAVRSPTIAELKTLGMLDASFSDKNYYSSTVTPGYKTTMRVYPTGCTGTGCSIFGMAYLTTQVVNAVSNLDDASVGEALAYGGGDIGVSTSLSKTTVNGYQGSWSEPNPVANTAGILAMRVVTDGSGLSATTTVVSGGGNLDMNNKAITSVDYLSGTVGQDLQIKTANGKDLYLQNINDTPSSNMYANFQNSTFTKDVTVMGTLYMRSGGGYGGVAGDTNGNLNVAAKSQTGSLNVNDVYIRSAGTGMWASDMAKSSFTGSTTYSLSGKTSLALGTHKLCVMAGDTIGTAGSTNSLNGSVGGTWTYSASVARTSAQATCFD